MISESQQKAKSFAVKHGYSLRKLKEGKVKVTRPDDSTITVHDFVDAKLLMMREVFGDKNDKNILS